MNTRTGITASSNTPNNNFNVGNNSNHNPLKGSGSILTPTGSSNPGFLNFNPISAANGINSAVNLTSNNTSANTVLIGMSTTPLQKRSNGDTANYFKSQNKKEN